MAETEILIAAPRERVGKGAARAARRAGLVPAVIYGGTEEPVAVTLNARELGRHLSRPGFFARIYDVRLEGGDRHRVLPREVQLHPVSDRPLHVDLLRVSASTEVSVAVPVEFLNEEACTGLRQGGVLNIVRHEVEVTCTPERIPELIRVDLAGVGLGESVHIGAVTLPDGVRPTIDDRDFTIATIAAPTLMAEAEDGEGEGEDGGDGTA